MEDKRVPNCGEFVEGKTFMRNMRLDVLRGQVRLKWVMSNNINIERERNTPKKTW